jgi:hypothetical protein
MDEVKGIISPQGEELIAELLDEKVKWKNPLMERLDGKMFQVVIKTIDNTLLEKIPPEWQSPIEPVIEAALTKDWELAAELISELVANKVDIPWLDEESEHLLFNAILSFVTGLIMAKVEDIRSETKN